MRRADAIFSPHLCMHAPSRRAARCQYWTGRHNDDGRPPPTGANCTEYRMLFVLCCPSSLQAIGNIRCIFLRAYCVLHTHTHTHGISFIAPSPSRTHTQQNLTRQSAVQALRSDDAKIHETCSCRTNKNDDDVDRGSSPQRPPQVNRRADQPCRSYAIIIIICGSEDGCSSRPLHFAVFVIIIELKVLRDGRVMFAESVARIMHLRELRKNRAHTPYYAHTCLQSCWTRARASRVRDGKCVPRSYTKFLFAHARHHHSGDATRSAGVTPQPTPLPHTLNWLVSFAHARN